MTTMSDAPNRFWYVPPSNTMVEMEKHYCRWFVLIPLSIGFEI